MHLDRTDAKERSKIKSFVWALLKRLGRTIAIDPTELTLTVTIVALFSLPLPILKSTVAAAALLTAYIAFNSTMPDDDFESNQPPPPYFESPEDDDAEPEPGISDPIDGWIRDSIDKAETNLSVRAIELQRQLRRFSLDAKR